jgi:hypothetical protein
MCVQAGPNNKPTAGHKILKNDNSQDLYSSSSFRGLHQQVSGHEAGMQ